MTRFTFDENARHDSRLAMSPEWFGKLRAAFKLRLEKHGGEEALNRHAAALAELPKYQPGGKGDLAMRLRWDLFWGVRSDLSEEERADLTYRQDLTDAQIDSVLRRFILAE